MRRNAIKKGCTYVGRNGKCRTVNVVGEAGGRAFVGYYDHSTKSSVLGAWLDDFARWASKEVKNEVA